jgi:hypothetical protein
MSIIDNYVEYFQTKIFMLSFLRQKRKRKEKH